MRVSFLKKALLGLLVVSVFMSRGIAFANEQDVMNQAPNEVKESKIDGSQKKGHFGIRVNLNPLYQGVGMGWRTPTFSGQAAHDISLSCNFVLWDFPDAVVSPTFGYEYIRYKPKSMDLFSIKYTGYGFDLYLILPLSNVCIIPNPKISFGTEFKNGHFSEWSVNVTPAVFSAMLLGSAIYYDKYECGYLLGLLSLTPVIEYRHGF